MTPQIVQVDLAAGDALPDNDGVTIAVVLPGDATPAGVASALAEPRLLSIGVVTGTPSASVARLLLACDFLVSATDAVWDGLLDEVSVLGGRLPADLITRVAEASRPVDGVTAVELGLAVLHGADPAALADDLAQELATVADGALSGTKNMVDSAAAFDLAAALRLEGDTQVALLFSAAHQAIVAARSNGRK